jgi:hypothetical protein
MNKCLEIHVLLMMVALFPQRRFLECIPDRTTEPSQVAVAE